MRPSSLLRSASSATSSSSSLPSYSKSLAYATTLGRKFDSDAIYPSYFAPAAARPAYLALRAFNVELATIDDNVSNPMAGRMRYQWWRDAVKGIFDVSGFAQCVELQGDSAEQGKRSLEYNVLIFPTTP